MTSAPTTFTGIDLNVLIPDKYTFPKRYWHMSPLERQVTWMLDQDRIDDAVVYFLHQSGPSFAREIPFLQSRPDPEGRIAQLRADGRVEYFNERARKQYRTTELVLSGNSGISQILTDLAFLSEPPNPGYGLNGLGDSYDDKY